MPPRHAEVAGLLLDQVADMDMQDTDGRTAVMIASDQGHAEFVVCWIG